MKIIFMGTPELAVSALKGVLTSKHEVAAVITQPDRESGRGRQVIFSPVKKCAVENGLTILQPEDISDEKVIGEIETFSADIFIVVAYAQKIPERLLNMPVYGCINVHPSLLPKYRGASPLSGPILNGDTTFGISIMRLCEKWDAGDILLQKEYPLEPKATTESLEQKVKDLCADMLLETMGGLEANTIKPVKQDDSKATYIKQIKKEEGSIDFSLDAVSIERKIRAYTPWPSTYTYLNGKVFKIWDADPLRDETVEPYLKESSDADVTVNTYAPGTVIHSDKSTVIIKCGEGALKLNEVQFEGKKRMNIQDFQKGNKIERGSLFGK